MYIYIYIYYTCFVNLFLMSKKIITPRPPRVRCNYGVLLGAVAVADVYLPCIFSKNYYKKRCTTRVL